MSNHIIRIEKRITFRQLPASQQKKRDLITLSSAVCYLFWSFVLLSMSFVLKRHITIEFTWWLIDRNLLFTPPVQHESSLHTRPPCAFFCLSRVCCLLHVVWYAFSLQPRQPIYTQDKEQKAKKREEVGFSLRENFTSLSTLIISNIPSNISSNCSNRYFISSSFDVN